MKIMQGKIKNNLDYFFIENRKINNVVLSLIFKIEDNKNKDFIALHILEHLFVKIKIQNAEIVNFETSDLGIQLLYELPQINLKILNNFLKEIENFTVKKQEFEKEKKIILNEFFWEENLTNETGRAIDLLMKKVYFKYKIFNTDFNYQDILNLSWLEFKKKIEKFLNSEKKLILIGDYGKDINNYFKKKEQLILPNKEVLYPKEKKIFNKRHIFYSANWKKKKGVLILFHYFLDIHYINKKEMVSLKFLAQLLFARNNYFFQKLREQEKLIYHLEYSFNTSKKHLELNIFLDSLKYEKNKVIKFFSTTLTDFTKKGLPEKNFKKEKRIFAQQIWEPDNALDFYFNYKEFILYDYLYINASEEKKILKNITISDLQKMTKKFLKNEIIIIQ